MSVVFKSQVAIDYYFDSVFEWYGDHTGSFQQFYSNVVTMAFAVKDVDFNVAASEIDFTMKVNTLNCAQE